MNTSDFLAGKWRFWLIWGIYEKWEGHEVTEGTFQVKRKDIKLNARIDELSLLLATFQ